MEEEKKKKFWETMIIYIICIVAGFLIYLFISNVWHPYLVSGNSMNPTYYNGNVLLCDVIQKDAIERGEIVVFKRDNKNYIKRVVAMPGDEVWIHDGSLYINGTAADYGEFEPIEDAGCAADKLILNDDEYFCLGDNRNHSNDSRVLGPIRYSEMLYTINKKIF